MNVLILWVFALGLICPSTTVLADEVPTLVRKVRQQNTLPPDMKSAVKGAPTTDPVIEEDGEFDDAQKGQQITEPTGIKKTTQSQATSTTPAVKSKDQRQDVKGATVSFLHAMEANEAEAAEMEFGDMLRQKIPKNFTKLPPIPEERGRGRHGLLNKL
uniref:Uncharacterized protein n=1 Tax=Anopheles coluzzii TaxID=1518534 RepID=A0A8W7PK80_ANOCL